MLANGSTVEEPAIWIVSRASAPVAPMTPAKPRPMALT
jgi:hypothetical protein